MGRNKSRLGFRKEEKPRKTAVDLFLEDEGPYSRKLYGPPPKDGNAKKSTNNKTKRAKSQEIVLEVSQVLYTRMFFFMGMFLKIN